MSHEDGLDGAVLLRPWRVGGEADRLSVSILMLAVPCSAVRPPTSAPAVCSDGALPPGGTVEQTGAALYGLPPAVTV